MGSNNLIINFNINKKTFVSFYKSPDISFFLKIIYTYYFYEEKNKKVNAAILIIGNEILSGRTQDKNTAFISNWLNLNCGITVKEVRIIPDERRLSLKIF